MTMKVDTTVATVDDDDEDETLPGKLVITNLSSSAGMQPGCALNIYYT